MTKTERRQTIRKYDHLTKTKGEAAAKKWLSFYLWAYQSFSFESEEDEREYIEKILTAWRH
jgi:hypothetical protein